METSSKENNFYDITLEINTLIGLGKIRTKAGKEEEDTIKDHQKGWIVNYSKEILSKYQKYKSENLSIIGLLGGANKGKTFLLQKLTDDFIPSDLNLKTSSLSIKYHNSPLSPLLFIDSAGLESPILKNKVFQISKDLLESNPELSNSLAQDRQLTEYFLQNFVITNSTLIICVINQLTLNEQKLINEIKQLNDKNKRIVVVHNLSTFIDKKQVQQYIKTILFKSLTFKLQTFKMVDFNNNKEDICNEYYKEINNYNYEQEVYHILMANENSQAGKFYNQSAINFLKTKSIYSTNLKEFPVVDTVMDTLVELSEKMFQEKLTNEDIIIKDIKDMKQSIELKDSNREIALKKKLKNELGHANILSTKFYPKFSYYISNLNYFIIELALCGDYNREFSSRVYNNDFNYFFEITGEKIKKENKKRQMLFDSRKDGKFKIIISHPIKENFLIDLNEKKLVTIKHENGIFRFEYKLFERNEKTEKQKSENSNNESEDNNVPEENSNDSSDEQDNLF